MPSEQRTYKLYSIKDLFELKEDPGLWIVPDMIPKQGRILVYGKGGEYKCRAAGQRVWLADGRRVPIDQLPIGKPIVLVGYDECARMLRRTEATVGRNGVKQIAVITTASGRQHKLTENEPLMTQAGWKSAGAVTAGDFLQAPAVDPGPEIPARDLRPGEAYLLGALAGDGSLTGNMARITCFDEAMVQHLRCVGDALEMPLSPNGNPAKRFYAFKQSRRWAERRGILGVGAHDKRVPDCIFTSSAEDAAEFLGGYWDADGHCSPTKREIIFTSCNRQLLEDIQSIMLRLGCVSSLNRDPYYASSTPGGHKFEFYSLHCCGKYAEKFLAAARVRSSKAARAKAQLERLPPTDYESRFERVPASLIAPLIDGMGQKFIRKHCGVALDFVDYMTRRRWWVKAVGEGMRRLAACDDWRTRCRSPLREVPSHELERRSRLLLQMGNDEAFYWDPVVEVHKEHAQTWSIYDSTLSTFICEDTLAHNSSLMFDLSVAVASGGKLLERLSVVQAWGPVILLSTEGSIYTNRNRLLAYMRARNVVPDAVQLHYGQQPLELKQDNEFQTLCRMVELVKPILLVLDPMVSFYGGNENDTEQMAKFVNKLNLLIEDQKLSVMIIHHANKIGEMRGSSVLQGWADSVIKCEVARKQAIPGLSEPRDVITVTSEKQRDGRTGKLFGAVPFFDTTLKMVTFGVYDTLDAKSIIVAHLKHEILKYLRRTRAVCTINQLAGIHHVGHQRVEDAIDWLEMNELITRQTVELSTGPGRSKTYDKAWKCSELGSRVDAARAMLKVELEHGLHVDDE